MSKWIIICALVALLGCTSDPNDSSSLDAQSVDADSVQIDAGNPLQLDITSPSPQQELWQGENIRVRVVGSAGTDNRVARVELTISKLNSPLPPHTVLMDELTEEIGNFVYNDWNGVGAGDYTLEAHAWSQIGGFQLPSDPVQVRVKAPPVNHPPNVEISATVEEAKVRLSVTATDEDGDKVLVKLELDGVVSINTNTDQAPFTHDLLINEMSSGQHTVFAKGRDNGDPPQSASTVQATFWIP